METYTTDEEQVEKIKKWWKANGTAIIAGLVIGVGGLLGWRYWNAQQLVHAGDAALNYSTLVTLLQEGELAAGEESLKVLQSEYGDTPYSDLGLMLLARLQVEQGQFEKARDSYQQLQTSSDAAIVALARVRLARILVQLQQFDDALQLLNHQLDTVFAGVEDEIRGDAFRLKGDAVKAAEAYRRAMNSGAESVNRRLLQQKLDDLPLATG